MQLPGILEYHDINLLPKDGSLEYFYPFFNEEDSDRFFQKLYTQTEWIQDEMEIYDKVHPLPRLISWYDESCEWQPELLEIKRFVEDYTRQKFNTVLLNLYRNESDHVSWHSDKARNSADNKVIVSISFGETRKFQVKHKWDKNLAPISIDLMPGSMVIMKNMQDKWLHRVAKTAIPKAARINLTFRNIVKEF
ncbi:MAG: alpha-ketoglutarate-dependent dioxygenase AlkB [Rhizobacter sp.]|nr:alpha-ketoglutarate-dependent dioxygenase AlkB [Bacteriovorax sp.]